MNNFFHPTNLLGRIVLAIFYAVCVYVVLLIIAAILGLFPGLSAVGAIVSRFAYLLALLAGLAAFFTGSRPV